MIRYCQIASQIVIFKYIRVVANLMIYQSVCTKKKLMCRRALSELIGTNLTIIVGHSQCMCELEYKLQGKSMGHVV